MMSQPQTTLIDRLRAVLANETSTREVSMFGSRSFMVNDAMVVGALKNGDLLVRAAPERTGELTALPGASPAEMGTGRIMGPGWIAVAADAITGDDRLLFWLTVALDRNRTMTGHNT